MGNYELQLIIFITSLKMITFVIFREKNLYDELHLFHIVMIRSWQIKTVLFYKYYLLLKHNSYMVNYKGTVMLNLPRHPKASSLLIPNPAGQRVQIISGLSHDEQLSNSVHAKMYAKKLCRIRSCKIRACDIR